MPVKNKCYVTVYFKSTTKHTVGIKSIINFQGTYFHLQCYYKTVLARLRKITSCWVDKKREVPTNLVVIKPVWRAIKLYRNIYITPLVDINCCLSRHMNFYSLIFTRVYSPNSLPLPIKMKLKEIYSNAKLLYIYTHTYLALTVLKVGSIRYGPRFLEVGVSHPGYLKVIR